MSSLRHLFGALFLISGLASSARAQSHVRLQAPSFVFARYASGSASALYAVRGFGHVGGLVAMVQNPETQYRELVVGSCTAADLCWNGRRGGVHFASNGWEERPASRRKFAPRF